MEAYIPDVYEEIVGQVYITTLTNRYEWMNEKLIIDIRTRQKGLNFLLYSVYSNLILFYFELENEY